MEKKNRQCGTNMDCKVVSIILLHLEKSKHGYHQEQDGGGRE